MMILGKKTLATSALITETSKKNDIILDRVPCIYYLLRFQKNIAEIKALIDSDSEINIISPVYILKLGLKIRQINIRA